MATIVGDVTGLQISHIVKKIKGFPLRVKPFQNAATYKKLRGGLQYRHTQVAEINTLDQITEKVIDMSTHIFH